MTVSDTTILDSPKREAIGVTDERKDDNQTLSLSVTQPVAAHHRGGQRASS